MARVIASARAVQKWLIQMQSLSTICCPPSLTRTDKHDYHYYILQLERQLILMRINAAVVVTGSKQICAAIQMQVLISPTTRLVYYLASQTADKAPTVAHLITDRSFESIWIN